LVCGPRSRWPLYIESPQPSAAGPRSFRPRSRGLHSLIRWPATSHPNPARKTGTVERPFPPKPPNNPKHLISGSVRIGRCRWSACGGPAALGVRSWGVKGLTNRRHTIAPLSPSMVFAVLRVPPDGFRAGWGCPAPFGLSPSHRQAYLSPTRPAQQNGPPIPAGRSVVHPFAPGRGSLILKPFPVWL
jgi:hypothetical protein